MARDSTRADHGRASGLPGRDPETTRLGSTLDRLVSAGPSLYRRHRPRSFADVVGQEHVVRTLRNAIEQGKVHHAYLFVGSRGTGKTSMAKILAACLNCVERADGRAVRRLRVLRRDPERDVARRDRDGRGVQQLGRRHPRAARERRLRAGLRALQGLHPRRGAHALAAGLERVPQDARGAAAEHDLRARHDRGREGAADGRRPLPPLRLRAPDGRAALARAAPRRRAGVDRDRARRARRCWRATRRARSATRSARSSSSSPTPARRSPTADVLAVLGVADEDVLFGALDAVAAHDARRGARRPPRASPRPAATWRSPRATSRSTRASCSSCRRSAACPPSCASRPSATRAWQEQAARVPEADLVRLLDLLADALRAVKDGADARTQLELALVKAATPRGRRLDEGAAGADRAARAGGGRPRRRRRAPARRPRPRRAATAATPPPPAPPAAEPPPVAAAARRRRQRPERASRAPRRAAPAAPRRGAARRRRRPTPRADRRAEAAPAAAVAVHERRSPRRRSRAPTARSRASTPWPRSGRRCSTPSAAESSMLGAALRQRAAGRARRRRARRSRSPSRRCSTAASRPRTPSTARCSARRCARFTGADLRLAYEIRELDEPAGRRRRSPATSSSRGSCKSSTPRRSCPTQPRRPT